MVNSAIDYAVTPLLVIVHRGFNLLEVLQGLKGKHRYAKVEIQQGQHRPGYSIQGASEQDWRDMACSGWKIRDNGGYENGRTIPL